MRSWRVLPCVAGMAAGLALIPEARAAESAAAFLSCVGIPAAASRLACYDRAASAARSLPAAEQPDFTPGKPLHAPHPPPPLASVTVELVSVTTNSDGKPVFNLANGQVWQGDDDDPVFAEPSGNHVTLTRAAFGLGTHLRVNNQTREIVVRRIE